MRGIRYRRDRASAPTDRTTRALVAEQRALAIARSLTALLRRNTAMINTAITATRVPPLRSRSAAGSQSTALWGLAPFLAACMRPGGGPRSARSLTPYVMSENQWASGAGTMNDYETVPDRVSQFDSCQGHRRPAAYRMRPQREAGDDIDDERGTR